MVARLVIGGSNGTVVVRSLNDQRETRRFSPDKGNGVHSIEFSRDERRLLVCYDNGEMAVYDSESGELVSAQSGQSVSSLSPGEKPEVKRKAAHFAAAFFDSEGGRVFLVRASEPSDSSGVDSRDNTISLEPISLTVLDGGDLKEAIVFRGHSDLVTSGCLSPDGRYFTTGSLDGTARIWDVRGPAHIGTMIAASRLAAVGSDQRGTAELNAPTLSQDGRLILAADIKAYRRGETDEFARIIDVASGKIVSRLTPERPNDESYFKEGLGHFVSQFSPDGKRLLTVSSDQHVRIIKPGTRAEILSETPVEQWPIFKELPYTPVRVWDVATGRELFHAAGLKGTVDWASFSSDGRRILTRSTAKFSECYVQPEDGTVVSSAVHLLADPGEIVRIWDATNGQLLWAVKGTC